MNCPNCSGRITENTKYCPRCGYKINNNETQYPNQINMNQNINMQNNYNEYFNQQNNQNIINDDMLITAYIGKNADKVVNSNFSICAFFFGGIYYAYRKLWLYCLIFPLINIILSKSLLKFIIYLIINIVLASNFKKIYLKHVYKQITKIKNENQNKTASELLEICRKKGGTSLIVPILTIVIGIVIPTILIISMTSKSVRSTVNKTSLKKLETSAAILADWYDRQYSLYVMSKDNEELKIYSDLFKNTCVTNNCISTDGLTAIYLNNDVLTENKIDPSNIKLSNSGTVLIDDSIRSSNTLSYVAINSTTGKSCVKLSTTNNLTVCSSSCTKEQCTTK